MFPKRDTYVHLERVKNKVTPNWLALENGTKDDLTCGPIPGGFSW